MRAEHNDGGTGGQNSWQYLGIRKEKRILTGRLDSLGPTATEVKDIKTIIGRVCSGHNDESRQRLNLCNR